MNEVFLFIYLLITLFNRMSMRQVSSCFHVHHVTHKAELESNRNFSTLKTFLTKANGNKTLILETPSINASFPKTSQYQWLKKEYCCFRKQLSDQSDTRIQQCHGQFIFHISSF